MVTIQVLAFFIKGGVVLFLTKGMFINYVILSKLVRQAESRWPKNCKAEKLTKSPNPSQDSSIDRYIRHMWTNSYHRKKDTLCGNCIPLKVQLQYPSVIYSLLVKERETITIKNILTMFLFISYYRWKTSIEAYSDTLSQKYGGALSHTGYNYFSI